MDYVGIVVDDLEAATAFFVEILLVCFFRQHSKRRSTGAVYQSTLRSITSAPELSLTTVSLMRNTTGPPR
jgi:hypothetical protein